MDEIARTGDFRGMVSKAQFSWSSYPRKKPWVPKDDAVHWLQCVRLALEDLDASEQQRVTKRQVFYRLVGAYGFPKNIPGAPPGDQPEKRLRTLILHACAYGYLDWRVFRDPTRMQSEQNLYAGPENFAPTVLAVARGSDRPRCGDKPVRRHVWVHCLQQGKRRH